MGYRQILQAIEALRPEASSSDGQIVCGDLNSAPESDVIEALLADGFDYAHRLCPSARTCNSNHQPRLIDHLLYRGSLRAHPISPAEVDAETPLPSAEKPSDHVPLTAEFDWAEDIAVFSLFSAGSPGSPALRTALRRLLTAPKNIDRVRTKH